MHYFLGNKILEMNFGSFDRHAHPIRKW